MRKILALMTVLIFLMLGSAANATLLSLGDTGTFGSIPRGAMNDVLEPIYGSGTTDRDGYFGSTVSLTAPAYLTFTFLGFEAAFANDFYFDGDKLFSTEDYSSTNIKTDILDSEGPYLSNPGVIPFSFWVNGELGVSNLLTNPDDSEGMAGNINFFVSFDDDPEATTGTSLVLFLDDGGAGNDDNHDDMAVRIVARAVPEPATMLLLGFGLVGLAAVGRKRLFNK